MGRAGSATCVAASQDEDPGGDPGPPLPRTAKKNVEVAAPALDGLESSSYPLKDRTVSRVRPIREEVTFCLPSFLQLCLSTRQQQTIFVC